MIPKNVPFLKWAGGKRWLISRYSELLDVEFKRYVEPFLGSGATFFALEPSCSILSDLNGDLIATYEAIRDDWSAILKKLRAHQLGHLTDDNYYYKVRSSSPRSSSSKAAKFIYLNRTCFNGLYRVNLRGEFNVPKGTKKSVVLDTDNFKKISNLLKNTMFNTGDFEDVLDKCGEGDFAFVDPPYTVQHNYNGFLKYNEKIFSWDDQKRLAATLKRYSARGGKALLTNAAHSSVKDLYQGIGDIRVIKRQSVLASESARRSEVEEIAVCIGYSQSSRSMFFNTMDQAELISD